MQLESVTQASTYSANHDRVESLFQDNEEEIVVEAFWYSKDTFMLYVNVNNYVERKWDSYAWYVCTVLYDHGFKGKQVLVKLYDHWYFQINRKNLKKSQVRCE